MPKKSAAKKKAEPSSPDDFAPPARILSDLVKCLEEVAESIELRSAEVGDVELELVKFEGLGGRAALAVLANVQDFDETILSKLVGGETRFMLPEVAKISRGLADRVRVTSGPEQMAVMMSGLAVVESMQELVDEAHEAREAGPPKQPTDEIYQFKITLLNVEPKIWRRIQVADCTLADLHYLIQAAMGWEDAHLYEFQVNRRRFVVPVDEPVFGYDDTEDPNGVLVSELLPEGRKRLKFKYLYDFGDDWWHEVRFEKRITPSAQVEYPVCVEGEGACPPEDSGGPWGYVDKLEVLADKDHPNYEEVREWIGDHFDPTAFDLNTATAALRKSAAYVEGEGDDFDEDDFYEDDFDAEDET
jgi:hypothetical protein